MTRIGVRKTYKLYVGGAFVRSESGRYDRALGPGGEHVANVPRGSRKDVRDAMAAARKAARPWAARTAYNRGQILYRAAEALESRADGIAPADELAASVDVLVHYAGWTDKIAAVLGGVNPVAAPFLSFSLPEPTGVVGVIAPQRSALLGLVSVVAPVIATGNTCVVVAATDRPLPAITLAEVLATSDLPGGVVNLLTGSVAELAPWLAAHADVNALDLAGVEPEAAVDLERAAAQTVKRVLPAPAAEPDWTADPGTSRLSRFLELKTVWHPMGV